MPFDSNTAKPVKKGFDSSTAKLIKDERASQFFPQMGKSMYEHVPFGKRVIQTVDQLAGTKMQEDLESRPEAEGFAGQAGELMGDALSFIPAWEAGAATMPLKMLGGSLGIGAQTGIEASNKGEEPQEALKQGATTTGLAFLGGKALEGAGKVIMNAPATLKGVSGRIHDYMVKVPTKGFSYGKDPLDVLAKEKITANTMHEYASMADDRLTQRTNELNEAVKKSTSKIDLEKNVDDAIKSAQEKAELSLQDRTELTNKLAEMRGRISVKYGNIKDMSISEAVKLKRQLADDFPFSPLESKGSTNNLLAKAAHKIHHEINNAIDVAAPGVSELNHRVSSLIDISQAAKNRIAVESRNHPLGLIASIVGVGVGGAVAGEMSGRDPLQSGLLAAALVKAAQSPAVLTRVANTLSKMSDVDKINLFKASPEFMELAQKASEYIKTSGRSFGTAGQAGSKNISKGGEVEAELLGGPAQKIGYQKPIRRQDRLLPSPQKSERGTGPVIKAAPPKPTTEDPSGFLTESKKKMGGTQIGNNKGSVNVGEDLRGNSKEELTQSLKHYENVLRNVKGQPDKSQEYTARTMVNKIKNAIADVGKSPVGLTVGVATAGVAATKAANAGENVDMERIYKIESSNNPDAYNAKAGARGLGQIRETVLREWNEKHPNDTHRGKELFDAEVNKKISDWYMNKRIPQMLKTFKIPDTVENRIIAYNFGIGNLKKGKPLPKETRQYIQKYKNGGRK